MTWRLVDLHHDALVLDTFPFFVKTIDHSVSPRLLTSSDTYRTLY